MYNFPSLYNKRPTIFLSFFFFFFFFFFHISLPKLGYFSYKKENQKFLDSKMWWREELKKNPTFVIG